MAELALALTCLGNIAEGFLGKVGEYLFAPIQRQLKYMCCFNSNITELETQLKKLETTKEGVQLRVNEDLRNVRIIAPEVKNWLERVDEFTPEVNGIIQDKAKVNEGCLYGWCPNLKLRYSLSRKAVKKTKVVIDLQAVDVSYSKPSYSPEPSCIGIIPNGDFTGFESRRLVMEEIIKALKNDEINLIGVCGMGGVGKTTLVKEVANRAKEDKHFDEVAMAVVGQKPDLPHVQACIADTLGLKNLRNTENPIVRADLLRGTLPRDNKKVLVILDDIWAEFDPWAMGIPLEGADKNFKMLYTSRTRDLWHDLQTKKEIPLELLSEDEAWQLFREKAGDLVEARDLQPIAKQIMNKCDRLPLALVSIGRALSKTSGRNTTKKIWEGMLNRLTCATSTPAAERLFSSLELSYKYLEDEEAKRLFLLCCLFQEDEDIRLEDLARYGFGLSLFDGMNQMGEVRRRVSLIVDDLKSRCLLLDSEEEKEECVKVHGVVRNMGISIASKDKFALVSHGAISQWPKMATHEHYTAVSVISDEIEELPEELTYPNLEFLMLRCQELEKLSPNFLEGMGKLKVLELHSFCGILTLQSLRNLTTLSLEGFCGTLDNVSLIGGIPNLEILNFRYLMIEELPEEIEELVNLRLLDLRDTHSLTRIPPGVISRLVHLEELYFWGSKFIYWEGEGSEEEGRNANLREFEFLSNLNTLEICIRSDVLIPKVPIFGKLKIFKVAIGDGYYYFDECNDDIGFTNDTDFFKKKCERVLWVDVWIPIPSDRGGIDSLLRSSDWLRLKGEGCNDLVRELLLREGVNGLQQLKVLEINRCDTPECLVNTKNLVHLPTAPAIFPILKDLHLCTLVNIREICRGPVPARSFGKLTSIRVNNCGRLGNLFQLPIEGYLAQLENLIIRSCDMMAEVFWKDQLEEVHVATNNRIVFPKLEVLVLEELPILMGFCRGIDQIDFPQMKQLELRHLRRFNRLFHDHCNLSSNSEQNDNVGFHSLFPQKVSFPNLVVLKVAMLENLERLGHGTLSVRSFSKLKECSVRFCGKLLCVFPSQLLSMLPELQGITVESCDSLEVIFELEGLDSNEPNPEILSPLKFVKLRYLPKLTCISKRDPVGFKYIQTLEICDCNSLRYVFAPTMTKSIPQLRKLKILRCEMLARIVAEENGLGESSEDEVEFPQLESLELLDVPNLLSFFPNVNVNTTTLAKSTDHYHQQPQPLFNEKVAIPSLEYLKLEGLQNVSGLWRSELPTSSFYKLKKLEVRGCANLRSTFHPSMVEGLANLLELVIADCSKMEGVVYWEEEIEDGQGRKVDKTLFPQLRKLQLCSLPNLESFFPNVNTNTLAKSTDHYHNLLQPQPLFNEKVGIPSLEYLKLEGLQNVSDLWSSELPTSSFYKLKKLEVRGCANLRNVFYPSVAGCFLNLQELVINDCSKMEGVVDWVEEREERQGTKIDRTLYYRLIKLENLEIYDCNSLRCVFAPTMAKSIPQLRKLKILRCKMLSRIVAEENGLGESSVDEVEFPQLESLELLDLPNLLSFFPNVNVNTTTLAKSTDHYHNPLQPQPLFNEKVAIPNLEYLVPVGLQSVSDLWGSELPSSSFSKLKNLQVTGCTSLRNFPFISWIGDLNNTTQGLQEVAQLLYTNSKWEGDGVLALGSNGTMTLWKWGWSQHNPSGKATTSAFPQQYWQPASGLAMTDDVTGVNLEEAVPCMALSKNGSYIISAYGGEISLFNIMTWRVMRTFMPPPPASTFLAFYPQDSNIIAIGMEDSTIRIYNVWVDEVKSELKGHKKRITGLAFSTYLNILVSSGADAQLCIWNINTWEHLKSVPIQLPAGKACNCDTRVQFHSDQIRLLVSHETQLAIYDALEMDCIRQWVPQDVLPAPISFAAYSCDSQLVYTSFSDGNIGVFDAYSLTCRCRIAPYAYSPTLASGSQDVYPIVVAAHPQQPNQFAIGLTNGFVIVMELRESEGKWGLFPPEMGC